MGLRKIKNEMIAIFIISGLGFIVVVFLSHFAISKFIINQELKKARLISHTLFYTREYLSKLAPYVKLINKHMHPFSLAPAVTVSEIAKVIKKKENFIIKQTSDRYRNVNNKPNSKEIDAIKYFKKNPQKSELFELEKDKNKEEYKRLYYFYPLKITKDCLKCHGFKKDINPSLYKKLVEVYGDRAFGYKLGDIRGVISVEIPLKKAQSAIDSIFYVLAVVLFIFYILGVYLFLKINGKIIKDINSINEHFKKYFSKNIFKLLKARLHYYEFENMKSILNNSVISIKRLQKETYLKTYFNRLTNLPNREMLIKKLSRTSKESLVVILIDIDEFKDINFQYGEEIADKLIVQMAQRLKEEKVYHIKIDQFAVVKNAISNFEIQQYSKKLIDMLEEPYLIDEYDIYIKVRAGISFKDKNLTNLIFALDATKILNKDIVFSQEAREIMGMYKEHSIWLKKIKNALNDGRIAAFYQPILNRDKKIVKYEALVRLIDMDGKVILPYFFLNIAKKSRLYFDITKAVITKTFETFKDKDYEISVNLSTNDLSNSEIRKFIIKKVREFPDCSRINFEIIEDEDIKELEEANRFLKDLKKEGCKISIDDFGSGYANFDYLLSLNADTIKIDGSLVRNIIKNKNSEIIVKTIITFAKESDKRVVAEFVENEEIFEKLKEMGIDYFQGYYFSMPLDDV